MNPQDPHFNPFPGLRPFQIEEKFLFFGREEQTSELLTRLRKTRFLAVVGVSGSGKSSLVRAGLLPELHGGTMATAGSSWEIAVMRPGGDPLTNLAEALIEADIHDADEEHVTSHVRTSLARSGMGLVDAVKQGDLPENTNLLLVVDQFEEIFRFRRMSGLSEEEAGHFITLLLEASEQIDLPIYVVLTMRSDFLGDCAQFRGLAESVNEGEYLIPRLNRNQRRQAIEGPVAVGQREITSRLVQRLLNDIGDDPDQLPILQHALMRTWDHWDESGADGPLDLDHYQATGGMDEALSRHADEVHAGLPDDEHRWIAEKLFKALTEKVDHNRGIRRPMQFRELCEIIEKDEDKIRTVVDAFRRQGRTFLMPSGEAAITPNTVIDISHESLMRAWRRLRDWVDDEAQSAKIYRRLADTSSLYQEGKAGYYRDPDLQIALSWREETKPNKSWADHYFVGFEEAMVFLDKSHDEAVREEREREEARKRELAQANALARAKARTAKIFKFACVGVSILAIMSIMAMIDATISRDAAQKSILEQARRSALVAQSLEESGKSPDSLLWLTDAYNLSRAEPEIRETIKGIFNERINTISTPIHYSLLSKKVYSSKISPNKRFIAYPVKDSSGIESINSRISLEIYDLKKNTVSKKHQLLASQILLIQFDKSSHYCYVITNNKVLHEIDLIENTSIKHSIPFQTPINGRDLIYRFNQNLKNPYEALVFTDRKIVLPFLVSTSKNNGFTIINFNDDEIEVADEISLKTDNIELLKMSKDGKSISICTNKRVIQNYNEAGNPVYVFTSALYTFKINSDTLKYEFHSVINLDTSIKNIYYLKNEKALITTGNQDGDKLSIVLLNKNEIKLIAEGQNIRVFKSLDENIFLTVDRTNEISVYDTNTINKLYEYNLQEIGIVNDLSIHPDNGTAAVASDDMSVTFFKINDGATTFLPKVINCASVRSVSFDNSGNFLFTSCRQNGLMSGVFGLTRIDALPNVQHEIINNSTRKRLTKYTVDLDNNESYSSYKLIFKEIFDETDANSMQIAEVEFLDSNGVDITKPGDLIEATSNNTPIDEAVEFAIDDNNNTKYLNFDKINCGFTVYPTTKTEPVTVVTFTTANDFPQRDPTEFILYGASEQGFYKRLAHGQIRDSRLKKVPVNFHYDLKNSKYKNLKLLAEMLSGKYLDNSGNLVPLTYAKTYNNWYKFNQAKLFKFEQKKQNNDMVLNKARYNHSINNFTGSIFYYENLKAANYPLDNDDLIFFAGSYLENNNPSKAFSIINQSTGDSKNIEIGHILNKSLILLNTGSEERAMKLLDSVDLKSSNDDKHTLDLLLLNHLYKLYDSNTISSLEQTLHKKTNGFIVLDEFKNDIKNYNGITIHGRFKLPKYNLIEKPMMILSKGGSFAEPGFSLGLGRFGIRFELQGKKQKVMLDNYFKNSDKWVYLSFTWDKNTGLMQSYINGNKMANSSVFNGELENTLQMLTLGRNIYRPTWAAPFSCSDLCIWNRSLKPSEIKEHIRNISNLTSDASVVGKWGFEDANTLNMYNCKINMLKGNNANYTDKKFIEFLSGSNHDTEDLYLILSLVESLKNNNQLAYNFVEASKRVGGKFFTKRESRLSGTPLQDALSYLFLSKISKNEPSIYQFKGMASSKLNSPETSWKYKIIINNILKNGKYTK